MENIEYPYIPEGREIKYVSSNNEFMVRARELSLTSGCAKHPTAAAVVKEGIIIGIGSNAAKRMESCARWGSPTGQNYESCKDICHQEGHSEVTSVDDAIKKGHNTKDADLYLYGHWWCCESCWNKMKEAGIRNVYLLEESWLIFNPEVNTAMKDWGRP